MTITVQQPVISKPLRYVEDSNPDQTSVPMRICTVPVSFNGTLTEAVAHCTLVEGVRNSDPAAVNALDDAPLKWANLSPGASRFLVGDKTVNLGLFEIRESGVYLHTVSDSFPRKPVITEPGSYTLGFRIDSPDHCMTFRVTLSYNDHSVSLGG